MITRHIAIRKYDGQILLVKKTAAISNMVKKSKLQHIEFESNNKDAAIQFANNYFRG